MRVLLLILGMGVSVVFASSKVPLLCSCVCYASYGSNGKFSSCIAHLMHIALWF